MRNCYNFFTHIFIVYCYIKFELGGNWGLSNKLIFFNIYVIFISDQFSNYSPIFCLCDALFVCLSRGNR